MKWAGWVLAVALSGIGALAPAQEWGGRWGRGGSSNEPMSAEEAAERLRRAEFFLQEMDQNRNGVLEAEEVEGRRRYFAERILQRAGMATEFPVAISKVTEGLRTYYTAAQHAAPGGAPSGPYPGGPFPGGPFPGGPFPGGPPGGWPPGGMPPGGGPPGGAPQSGSGEPGSGSANTPAAPLVPGFGVPNNLPPPPGFGLELAQAPAVAGASSNSSRDSGGSSSASSSGSSEASSSGSSSSTPSSSGGDELAERYRRYAPELLKKYDKNGNGQLERDEWKEMSGNPENADRNHDGIITLDELTARLIEMGRSGSSAGGSSSGGSSRGGPPGGSGSSSRGARSGPSSGAGAAKPALRFRTAAERLPEGLPDWFAAKDADGDGQVAMAEYATTWSDRTVADFARYDLDHDGFITPAECLAALNTPDSTKSSSSSDPKPPAAPSSQPAGESKEDSETASGETKPGDDATEVRPEHRGENGDSRDRRNENGESRDRRGGWGRR